MMKMKKRILLCVPVVAAAMSVSAQAQLSVADWLKIQETVTPAPSPGHHGLKAAVADEAGRIELIMRIASPDAEDAIVANGGEIIDRITSRSLIVSVPAVSAAQVAASEGVRSASLSVPVNHLNNVASELSGVDKVHAGTGLPRSFNGEGVVVGLFDIGMDPNHINFRDTDGTSRVKRLWEYEGATSRAQLYDSPAAISTFESDAYNDSHGTHVMGIMAGSFADPADPAHDYRGMAPGAELAVACGAGYDAQILGGIKEIARYAREQGKPCVINLSFGNNIGPHDGSDDFTATINDVAEEYDAVVCMASGNERDKPVGIVKHLTEESAEVKTLLLPGTAISNLTQAYGEIQVWGEDETPFEVSLEIIRKSKPNEPQYALEIPETKPFYAVQGTRYSEFLAPYIKATVSDSETGFTSVYNNSYMGGVRGVDPYNHRYNADINVYLESKTSALANSTYVCLHVKGEPGKKVFVYCDGIYINFGHKMMPGFDRCDGNGTNSSMGSGPHTLCVGSYVARNVAESAYREQDPGELSYFSSYGEIPDGRVMPDVCAPGQVIISSRNRYLGQSENALYVYPLSYAYTDYDERETYYWSPCAGTSQASPHMAGIAALWLSANPSLTHMEIKEIARETAVAGPEGEDGWGCGMVDAYAGLKRAISLNSVKNVYDNAGDGVVFRPMPANGYEIFAPGETSFRVVLTDMSGSAVRTVTSDGDTLRFSADGVTPGIYLLTVAGDRAASTLKIAVK